MTRIRPLDLPGFRTHEFALIAAATSWPLSDDRCRAMRDAAVEVRDWQAVLGLIDRHRIAGLASHSFSEAGLTLPADVHAALRARASADAIRELSMLHTTLKLSRLIAANAIGHRVLKGVTTSVLAFRRFGLRCSVDIDLLVAKADVLRASQLLQDQGYTRVQPAEDAKATAIAARMKRHKDFAFVHATTGIAVELHWRLFQNPYILPVDQRDPVATIQVLLGVSVPVLEPEMALLYLCVHGGEHGWARLKWLADLGALLNADAGAAERLYRSSRSRNLSRMVGPGLLLAHRIYGTPLPVDLANDVDRDFRMRWVTRNAWENMVGDETARELEEHEGGTTRKNFSHYMMSSDPRRLWKEFLFDLFDKGSEGDDGAASRLSRVASRIWSNSRQAYPVSASDLKPALAAGVQRTGLESTPDAHMHSDADGR